MPTHYAVTLPAEVGDMATLLAPDIRPTFRRRPCKTKAPCQGAWPLLHEGPNGLVEVAGWQQSTAVICWAPRTLRAYAVQLEQLLRAGP